MPPSERARLDPRQGEGVFPDATKSQATLTCVNALPALRRYSQRILMKPNSRILFGIAALAALSLSGCGRSDKSADTAAPSAPAPAAGPAAAKPAAGRAIAITANDTMKFNVVEIRAKAGVLCEPPPMLSRAAR